MPELEVIQHGSVAEVRLARNSVNSLSPDLVAELARVLGDLSRDPGVGALVLGSTADKFFSAGFDIPQLLELSRPDMADFLGAFNRLTVEVACLRVGTVAALEGFAVAGGFILALACDYRVMAAGKRKVGLTEVDLRLPLPLPAAWLLREVAGGRGVRELALAGRLLSPDEALAAGCIDRVVEPTAVKDAAHALAMGLAAKPPGAVATMRPLLRAGLLARVAQHGAAEEERFLDAWFHPATRPLIAAAAEKLRPRDE